MKTIKLNVQSIVDIITNSSTEVYMIANEDTIEKVEQIINTILSLGGSKLKCENLFKISLGEEEKYSYQTFANVPILIRYIGKGKNKEEIEEIMNKLNNLFQTMTEFC